MANADRHGDTVIMTYARSQIAPPGDFGCFHGKGGQVVKRASGFRLSDTEKGVRS